MEVKDLKVGDVIKSKSSVPQTVVYIGNLMVVTEFFNDGIQEGKKLLSSAIKNEQLKNYKIVEGVKCLSILIDGDKYSVEKNGKVCDSLTLGEVFEQIVRESGDVKNRNPYIYN